MGEGGRFSLTWTYNDKVIQEINAFIEDTERSTRRRLTLILTTPCVVLVLFFAACFWGGRLDAWWRDEADLQGNRIFLPVVPPDPVQISGMDLQQIHQQLLPDWVAAINFQQDRSASLQEKLRRAISDGNLRHLLEELGLATRAPEERADRIFYLVWAWNRYLDLQGLPWQIDLSIRTRPRALLHLKTYHVTRDLSASDGVTPVRVRYLRRADRAPHRELHLGVTGGYQRGAFVLVERVFDFAVEYVWPLLDPDQPPRGPLSRNFADHLRREARGALGEETFRLLVGSVADRVALLHAARAINHRRGPYAVQVKEVPLAGFTPLMQQLISCAEPRRVGRACSRGGVVERRLVETSRRLQGAIGLEQAVGALAAWIARGVTLHEARHALDDFHHGREPLPCSGCPEGMAQREVCELSAYLTGIAARGYGYVNVFQACFATTGDEAVSAANVVTELLGDVCRRGPGGDLYAQAAQLERRLFGKRDAPRLLDGFPRSLGAPEASWP